MAANDYSVRTYYWPIGYVYWPTTYYYWPIGFTIGLGIGREYVVPTEDRTLIVDGEERVYVVPAEDRYLTVEE